MSIMRPRVLFLTPVVPARTGMGLAMRAASQLAGLMQVADVTVAVIPVIDSGAGPSRFTREFPRSELVLIDPAGGTDPYFQLIASMDDDAERLSHFERYGRPSLAASVTPVVARQVADCAARCGAAAVHVFRSYLLGALDDMPPSLIRTLDLDEDDAASFLSSAAVHDARGEEVAARWARLEAQAFDRLIASKARHLEMLMIANEGDGPAFAKRHPGLPVRALANCIGIPPLSAAAPAAARNPAHLLFVGALRYAPNVDGLLWFMENVLPRLPGAMLTIVGRDPPRVLGAFARPGRVRFAGFAEDLSGIYRESAIAIAPMRSGGGTRLKILEAGAHAVPVVATPEAAAGLWTCGRAWGMTASGPARFAAACRHLISHPRHARRLGMLGRGRVAARFGSNRIEGEWAALFRKVLRGEQQ